MAEWLWPMLCPGISYRDYWKLISLLGSPQAIRTLSRQDAVALQIDPDVILRLNPSPDIRQNIEEEIEKSYRWLVSSKHHHLILPGDQHYPDLLREIPDPPPLLFASGNLHALDYPSVAIVGSRHCTPYGVKMTKRLAADLSDSGLAISSGLALGIDAVAHGSCVKRGKPTIAILGSGLANIYPRQNLPLAQQIIAQGGLLLSEFPLSTPPAKYRFPRRNRLISGLSLATCVVEANLRSGSLITARLALEQNRQVFAVPGSVDSQNSRGCHRLLREGAAVAENAADIKSMLGPMLEGQIALLKQRPPLDADHENLAGESLTAQESRIMKRVDVGPVDTDALLKDTQMTISTLQQCLAKLELCGDLVYHSGKWFRGN